VCEPSHSGFALLDLSFADQKRFFANDKATDLEPTMTAFAKAVSQAFISSLEDNETLKKISLFCAAGLLVSVLLLTYGVDLSPGFF
jgi:hypothetical protein